MMSDERQRSPRIDAFGLTDTGKLRSHNEDQFLVGRLEKSMERLFTSLPDDASSLTCGEQEAFIFVVADGVGGAAAGELASVLMRLGTLPISS